MEKGMNMIEFFRNMSRYERATRFFYRVLEDGNLKRVQSKEVFLALLHKKKRIYYNTTYISKNASICIELKSKKYICTFTNAIKKQPIIGLAILRTALHQNIFLRK